MQRIPLVILGLAMLILAACGGSGGSKAKSSSGSGSGGSGIVAKGSRELGMDFNDPSGGFGTSLTQAQGIGIHVGTVAIDWGSTFGYEDGTGTNCTPGAYSTTLTGIILPALDGTYTTTTNLLTMTVRPINAGIGGANQFPTDLAALAASDSNVICRFNKFMDAIVAGLPNVQFANVQIGNELDSNPNATSSTFWSDYKTFLAGVVPHLHTAKPGVKVGFTVTLGGVVGNSGSTVQAGIQSLLSEVDVVGVTYYPLDPLTTPAYGMKSPSVVSADIAALVQQFPSTPIYLQEVGYASQGETGCPAGSQANQATFVSNLFTAWDAHAASIPQMSFVRMNDWTNTQAQSSATSYGLGTDACFVDYLQYLGFYSVDGSGNPIGAKTAWSTLQQMTHERGWW